MTKNYFELALENPREHSQQLFGKNGKAALAAKIAKEDPVQYASLRRDAGKQGLLTPTSAENAAVTKHQWAEQRNPSITSHQFQAITRFPKATFREVTAEQVVKLKREDPEAYKLYRIAGATHGYLPQNI